MKFKPNIKKLVAFAYYHLTHRMEFPIGDFHTEMAHAFDNPRIAIAAPRGHAKSTWASFFYPLFMALENPGINILLVSATNALAEHWLDEIRKELETNSTIHDFYGKQESDGTWNTTELNLGNGTVIQAKGAGKQIRGFRPHLIIGDDLETDEMVLSKDQRDKFDDWFWATLVGTMRGDDTQVIVVGTVLHPESFLALLIERGRAGWKTKFYQALKSDGTSLWPDMWPTSVLHARKAEMGDYAFAQEYQNSPIPDDMRIFQKSWFRYFETPPTHLTYFTTVDVAIEVGDKNDYTAVVTCGVDSKENIYIVEVVNKRLQPNETIDLIFDTYKRWKPAVIGIESVGFQKMLYREMERQKKLRKEFPVTRELKSEGRRKLLRIEALQPRFQAGMVHLRADMKELETQLLCFPSTREHDDIIDALAYQLDILRAAPKEQIYVNPDSIGAIREARRKSKSKGGVWGNHNLRNTYGWQ